MNSPPLNARPVYIQAGNVHHGHMVKAAALLALALAACSGACAKEPETDPTHVVCTLEGLAPEQSAEIVKGIESWEAVTPFRCAIRSTTDTTAKPTDGEIVFRIEPMVGHSGLTYIDNNVPPRVIRATTRIADHAPVSYYRAIVAHELGHSLGLTFPWADPYHYYGEGSSIMTPTAPADATGPSPIDVAAYEAVWGG